MPARIARANTSAPQARRERKKSQKRVQDAFAIAGHEEKPQRKTARNRLGELDADDKQSKRRRMSDVDEDDDEDHDTRRAVKRAKGPDDDYGIETGSDDEGNHWTIGGPIDEDDDSEIDSDAAFGESDEEPSTGYTFKDSTTSTKTKGKSKSRAMKTKRDKQESDVEDHLLDESDPDQDDIDGLGDGAVDLATMLDDDHATDVSESQDSADDHTSDDDAPSDSATDMSDVESDDADPEKLAKLQDLVASLESELGTKQKSAPFVDSHEAMQPSAFGLTSSQKLKITDLLPTVTDPALRKSLKVLANDKPAKSSGIPGKLEAPLPKRQQDKLDRIAANQKAKETLERWRDTVIRNRRADHLQFPLADPSASEALGTKKLVPTSLGKPQNELESAIQDILEQSGLSTSKRDADEQLIQQAEELATNKLPLEEVLARRAELRKTRELLFREEIRAKRVKKIKSKSYRRVHRREREKQKELEGRFFDGEDDGDEKERQDRRRAEERMGAKHRDSKWAKSMKQAGRTVWDDDARDGMIDMARRSEDLRKRMHGKDVNDDGSGSESYHTSDDDSEDTQDDQAAADSKLSKQLNRLDAKDAPSSGLGSMAFMQRADAARRAENDATVEEIRREMAGEEEAAVVDHGAQLGRRIFDPTGASIRPAAVVKRPEMEERAGSDDDDQEEAADDVEVILDNPATNKKGAARNTKANKKVESTKPLNNTQHASEDEDDDPWLTAATGNRKGKSHRHETDFVPERSTASLVSEQAQSKPSTKVEKSSTLAMTSQPVANENEHDSDDPQDTPLVSDRSTQAMYHARAFAGDEADTAFAVEKTDQAIDEDEKHVSTHLPGWGSWTGDGLSKSIRKTNARQAHNPLYKTKVSSGIAAKDRRDAKLDNVILSEAQQRKSKKYLALQLPHEYEKKAQYERSLRIPIGPEWTTKDTFQRSTKPRVIVKQGIIAPMDKPMV